MFMLLKTSTFKTFGVTAPVILTYLDIFFHIFRKTDFKVLKSEWQRVIKTWSQPKAKTQDEDRVESSEKANNDRW